MRDPPWPLQCFTVLIAGRISLINFHCKYLISVVVVPSTVNTKNSLFRSIAMADKESEDLLSALDWALFPCRPCPQPLPSSPPDFLVVWTVLPVQLYFQLHVNPSETLLMTSRIFFYVSLPTYQSVFKAQNPWLMSSFLFNLIPTCFWENWADCHSPPCLHGWLCLPKGKILHFPSIAFLGSSLICNYHTVLHHVPPGLMLSSSLINRVSTHKPSHHLQCYEKMKWYKNQHRAIKTFPLNFVWTVSYQYCICLRQVLSK